MRCPYCVSEISEQALVCPVCTRELSLVKTLLERQAALEQLNAAQAQEIATLAARIEALAPPPAADAIPAMTQAGAFMEPPALSSADQKFWKSAALNLVFALVSIHAASWFSRLIYDAPDLLLRMLTIAISLIFGYVLVRRHPHRVSQTIVPALLLGVTAVVVWRALNLMINNGSFVPPDLPEWRNAIEYAVGMALAFFTGALLRRAQLLGTTQRGKPSALMRSLAGLFRTNEKGASGVDALAHTIQKAVSIITPAATGISAIYAVVKSMGGPTGP